MDHNEKNHVAAAGLLQVFAIVAGYLALGVVMKFNGYPDEHFIRWNSVSRGLREHGVWLMVVPLIWFIGTVVTWNYQRIEVAVDFAIGLGYLSAILLLIVFLWAAFDSCRRPLLFSVPTKSSNSAPANPVDSNKTK